MIAKDHITIIHAIHDPYRIHIYYNILSLLKLNNFPTMKSFAECPPLFLALLLLALPQNEYTFVEAHFIFTKLVSKGNNDQDVHVFFQNL